METQVLVFGLLFRLNLACHTTTIIKQQGVPYDPVEDSKYAELIEVHPPETCDTGEVTTTTARTERSTFHELEPLLLKINHQGPGVIDESMVKKMLANDSYDVVIPNPAQGYCPCGNYDGDYKALPSRSRKTLRPWMALIRITGEETEEECTGVLINAFYVLTTASSLCKDLPEAKERCVKTEASTRNITINRRESLGVYLSDGEKLWWDEGRRKHAAFVLIPGVYAYSPTMDKPRTANLGRGPNTNVRDMALIKLQLGVRITEKLQPICLPPFNKAIRQSDPDGNFERVIHPKATGRWYYFEDFDCMTPTEYPSPLQRPLVEELHCHPHTEEWKLRAYSMLDSFAKPGAHGPDDACFTNQFGPAVLKKCVDKNCSEIVIGRGPLEYRACSQFKIRNKQLLKEKNNLTTHAFWHLSKGKSEYFCFNEKFIQEGKEIPENTNDLWAHANGWCPTNKDDRTDKDQWGFCLPSCNERNRKEAFLAETAIRTFPTLEMGERKCYADEEYEFCTGLDTPRPDYVHIYVPAATITKTTIERIPVEPNTTDFFLKRYSHLVNKHWPDMYGAPCKGDKGAPIWKNFELPTDDTANNQSKLRVLSVLSGIMARFDEGSCLPDPSEADNTLSPIGTRVLPMLPWILAKSADGQCSKIEEQVDMHTDFMMSEPFCKLFRLTLLKGPRAANSTDGLTDDLNETTYFDVQEAAFGEFNLKVDSGEKQKLVCIGTTQDFYHWVLFEFCNDEKVETFLDLMKQSSHFRNVKDLTKLTSKEYGGTGEYECKLLLHVFVDENDDSKSNNPKDHAKCGDTNDCTWEEIAWVVEGDRKLNEEFGNIVCHIESDYLILETYDLMCRHYNFFKGVEEALKGLSVSHKGSFHYTIGTDEICSNEEAVAADTEMTSL